ncbi:hypothetical protein P4H66_19630 [Paenibacillus dokdonensis]|uniref:Uncharacterized protein n=1 Tax=Paenibacillus dokdonensis TaxID=2567944 RepID=A0ABU6GV26_9BACL|nr:hypothetical protein [Paenibacillus dokdonensis]MEC0242017.1 hypothetical protein [Paenibacillus dokdonensis]
MDKHNQSRVLRTKLRELYEEIIEAANLDIPIGEIHVEVVFLSSQLQKLEKSIGKNEEYEGLEVPKPSGNKVSEKRNNNNFKVQC